MFFGVAELAAWAPPPRRTSSEVNNRPFQQSASFSWKMLMFGQPKHMLCQLEDALKTLRCVFCVHTILSGMVLIEVLHLFSTTPIPMQLAVRRPTEKSCLELTVDDFIRAPILANCCKRNLFSKHSMTNINEAGNAIANLRNAENGIVQILPDQLAARCGAILYILYTPIKETTELQLLIEFSYSIRLCIALILAYPIYRVLARLHHHWRGWLIELTHWNGREYELYVLRVYAAFGLFMFMRIPLGTLMVLLSLICIPEIANADLENVEGRIDQALPNDLLNTGTLALYLLYPAVKDMVELQLLIGISYEVGLCFALSLLYPIYRVFPRFNHHWRGLAIEMTSWNGLEYEFCVLRLYAAFSLSLFLHMPISILALSLVFARLPLRYRIASVVLVVSVSYFWWYDVLASGSLYELRKLSWTGCVLLIIVFACSINNAALVFRPVL